MYSLRPFYMSTLQKLQVLRNVVGVIKLSQMCVTITILPLIKYLILTFHILRQIDSINKGIFRKGIISPSKNLYMILYLDTKLFCKLLL